MQNKRKLSIFAKNITVMHWSIVVKDERNEWNWVNDPREIQALIYRVFVGRSITIFIIICIR